MMSCSLRVTASWIRCHSSLANRNTYTAWARIRPRYSGSCSQREEKIRADSGLRGRGATAGRASDMVAFSGGKRARVNARPCPALGWWAPHPEEPAMIELYYWPTPNGHKVTLLLEELAEAGAPLEYRIVPVDIGKGAQFEPGFLRISPNNKMPAIVDHAPEGGGEPLSVFESGAILEYLADKTGRFL